MSPEPILLSWSGGKDSALALRALRADPAVHVVELLTSVTEGYDRVSIHGVRRSLLHEQAAALGVTLREVRIPQTCSNQQYETAMQAALDAARAAHPGLRRVAFGDLFLADVRAYREERLAGAGMEGVFPLWGAPTAELARRFVRDGFRARLVCVDTEQLDAAFCGRGFDDRLLAELPDDVDPCGERGEFHTFVYDGPGFSRPVPVRPGEVILRDGRFAFCDLLPRAAVLRNTGPGIDGWSRSVIHTLTGRRR